MSGSLAFQSNRAGRHGIFILDLASGAIQRLTAGVDDQGQYPAWAPDGRRLAFATTAFDRATFDVAVLDVQTGEVLRVTADRAYDLHPAWSRDGRSVFFSSPRAGTQAVFRARIGSPDEVAAVSSSPERALMPDAAPDGQRIAYVLGSEQGLRIVVHDLSSGATEAISPAGVDVAEVRWSPDGSRLAFARVAGASATLDLIDANGGGWRSLRLRGRAASTTRLVAGRALDRGGGRRRWQRRLGFGADRRRRAGPRASAHVRAVGGPRPGVASGPMSAAVRAAALHTLSAAVLGAVFVYIVARAVRVPLTYDEATTFYRHVEGGPAALLDFTTAGNHLLNSALTWGAHLLFGSAPLALRLPNVVAGACYLGVVAAIARRMRQPAIGLAAVLLLTTNRYLLEFFALSRGYGLAVALVTAGGWCLARWYEGSREAP